MLRSCPGRLKGIGTAEGIDDKYSAPVPTVNMLLTENDGYFNFLGLAPGSYTASIDSNQLAKLKLTALPSSKSFNVEGAIEGAVVSNIEFKLQSNLH
jgi:hypothetical protein